MEILFVSHKHPPATGGMEKQSFELINHMNLLAKVHSIVYEGKESRVKFFLKLALKIRKIIKDNPGISVIHYNDGLVATFSMLHRRLPDLKRTVTLHGLDVVFPLFLYQKYIFPKFNKFDLVIAVSSATATACIKRGIAADKVVVINNGVDTTEIQSTARAELEELFLHKYNTNIVGKRVLVTIGRAVKRKGFSWFVEKVMPLLHKDYVLLMIGPVHKQSAVTSYLLNLLPAFIGKRIELFLGSPSDERSLRRLMKQNKNKKNIVRLGTVPKTEINLLLGHTEAFVMPNIEINGDMEGFGLVCLEASVQGTKVFAAVSGGIVDAVIDNKNGKLLPPGHIVTWANALNQIIENPRSQLTSQEISSFTQAQFSWQRMAGKYFQHFVNLSK